MNKKLVSTIYLKNGKAVKGFQDYENFADGDAVKLAELYSNKGADALLIFDLSEGDAEHEESLGLIKEMSRLVDIPMYGAGNVRRVEDVKKLIYAGCRKAVLNYSKASNMEMLEEVSKRFGKEKIAVCIFPMKELQEKPTDGSAMRINTETINEFASEVIAGGGKMADTMIEVPELVLYLHDIFLPETDACELLKQEKVSGYSEPLLGGVDTDIMGIKETLKAKGIEVNTYESSFSWSDFKVNSDGLVPVIVQDYKTQEVLMMAYMNQEAFETTVRSGRMTYWSRSRQELWMKGLTSGHFQYVKELQIDCDNDTILAKVAQVGAACHTGNPSCFYRTMMKKDYVERNPMKVFEDVYAVILDRKANPKEGSYTNYLFDKGIDKILKKVGEEAAEIIIAAKNPNPEEIKYEISDFLYHVMVLMAERGVTWEEIGKELADR